METFKLFVVSCVFTSYICSEMKEKIKKAAFELFLKYGLKSVSMDDIAKSVGVSKKTIYLHIKDKNSLVSETLQSFLEEDQTYVNNAIERKDCNALDKMVIINQKGLEIFRKMKPTLMYDLRKYYRESWDLVQSYHFEFMREIIKQNITEGIHEQVYREDADPDIVSKLFVGKMIMLAEEDQFPNSKYQKSTIFIQQLLYHLYGIVNYANYPKLDIISKQFKQTN